MAGDPIGAGRRRCLTVAVTGCQWAHHTLVRNPGNGAVGVDQMASRIVVAKRHHRSDVDVDRIAPERAPMGARERAQLNREDQLIGHGHERLCGVCVGGGGRGGPPAAAAPVVGTVTCTLALAEPFAVRFTGAPGGVTVHEAGAPVTLRVTGPEAPLDVRCTWIVTLVPSVVGAAVSAVTL